MPRKGLNIHKRKDGRWEGRYKVGVLPNGHAKYVSVYGKTYTETEEKLHDAIAFKPIPQTRPGERTFSEITRIWLDNNRLRQKGATEHKYLSLIERHIEPALGDFRVSDVTSPTVNRFLAEKLHSGRIGSRSQLSPSYVRTMALIIQSVMRFAAEEEYCSPLKTGILKPTQERKGVQVLTDEEEQILEEYCFSHLAPIPLGILLTLNAGLRIGEVCALTWEDVDLNDGVLRIRHTVSRVRNTDPTKKASTTLIIDTPKTAASARDIPIVSSLRGILEGWKDGASGYVVPGSDDFLSPKTYDYRYRRILDACGVRQINYHALRHTFATRCIESGMDVKSLSEILGHANAGITLNTYVHSSMERKRKQLERLHT